jgi:MFS family permease
MLACPAQRPKDTFERFSVLSILFLQLLNWGPIMYLPFALPFAFLMDQRHGCQRAMWIGTLLVLAGAVFRCLATDASTTSIAFLHTGYICNAIAGPVAMALVSKLAEDWCVRCNTHFCIWLTLLHACAWHCRFPPHERATATAIASEANILGSALSFILGPNIATDSTMQQLMVRTHPHIHNQTYMRCNIYIVVLQLYNYIGLATCAFCAICTFAYFPSKPPTAPSKSACTSTPPTHTHAPSPMLILPHYAGKRPIHHCYSLSAAAHSDAGFSCGAFVKALKSMCSNKDFIVLCLAYGLGCGMSSGWSNTLNMNLDALHYGEQLAGWIGFANTIGTCNNQRNTFSKLLIHVMLQLATWVVC